MEAGVVAVCTVGVVVLQLPGLSTANTQHTM